MALKFAARLEPVPEKARNQMLVFGERNHAVAQVARRKHVEVPSQASAGSSVVRNGYNGCKIADEMGSIGRNRIAERRRRNA